MGGDTGSQIERVCLYGCKGAGSSRRQGLMKMNNRPHTEYKMRSGNFQVRKTIAMKKNPEDSSSSKAVIARSPWYFDI